MRLEVRWDNLFDDLEGQLEQELTAEDVDLRAEEERLRLGRLSVRDRLVAVGAARPGGSGATGSGVIRLELTARSTVAIRPKTFGRDWLAGEVVEDSVRRAQCILPLAAIAAVLLTRDQVALSLDLSPAPEHDRGLSARLGIAFVLRDLCRRRKELEVLTMAGTVHGTIDRVGRDHLDLAVHESGVARRESAVSQYRLIPFDQVQLVRL